MTGLFLIDNADIAFNELADPKIEEAGRVNEGLILPSGLAERSSSTFLNERGEKPGILFLPVTGIVYTEFRNSSCLDENEQCESGQ